MFTSNCTTQIHEALCEQRRHRKKKATGTRGTRKCRK